MKNILKLIICSIISSLIMACKAEPINMTFMVYNYSTYGLAEISVNADTAYMNVGAAEKLGSVGGGGTACCIALGANREIAEVSFFTDMGDGYKQYHIQVPIPIENLKDTPRSYAVLHYFPNNTGVIELSMRRPSFRKDLFDQALGEQAKNIQLTSPTMWHTIPENEVARIEFPD